MTHPPPQLAPVSLLASLNDVFVALRRSAQHRWLIHGRCAADANSFSPAHTDAVDQPTDGAALHRHAFRQRPVAVLGPATGRQDDAAATRRGARGVEHGNDVLPARPAGRLWVRPPAHPRRGAKVATMDTRRPIDCGCERPALRRRQSGPADRCRRVNGCVVACRAAVDHRRPAIFCPVGIGSPLASLVHPHRPPDRGRPLFSLQRQQPRQPCRFASIPAGVRTADHPVDAESPVDGRLQCARAYGHRLRRSRSAGRAAQQRNPRRERHRGSLRIALEHPGIVDRAGLRPLQSPPRRHVVHHDGCRVGPAAVGDTACALSSVIRRDLRSPAADQDVLVTHGTGGEHQRRAAALHDADASVGPGDPMALPGIFLHSAGLSRNARSAASGGSAADRVLLLPIARRRIGRCF